MGAQTNKRDGEDRVPRLAPDFDPSRVRLSPAEGYLLSRVDGVTRWSMLREIGGMPPEDADRRLERWLREGLLVVGDPPPAAGDAPKPTAASGESKLPEAKIDASLDITAELQREILAFEAKLDAPYHDLLGIPMDAGGSRIKKAYHTLSKTYHPDRYFRRNLGPFQVRIERIFKKVLEAYEMLSDPVVRAELQKSAAATPPPTTPASPGKVAPPKRRIAARLSLMAQHRRHLDERKRRAKQLFESGMAAFHAENWLEAARGVRLAIAFDPQNAAIRDSFADVQRRAHEEQAKLLTRKADEAYDLRDFADAERHYEEALHYRPFDGGLAAKVARLALQVSDDLKKAKEHATTACEMEPENPSFRVLLGCIYKAAGLKANAKREFETAVRLEPGNRDAKAELKSL